MDPNSPVGEPRDVWVWLAPDWSDYRPELENAPGKAPPGAPRGATRVKIRETIYGDGRIVRHVLDANGEPLAANGQPARTSPNGARELDRTPQYDKAQQERYDAARKQAASAASSQPPTTKDEGGRRYQWKPNPGGPSAGGEWIDIGPAPLTPAASGQGTWSRVEGTPIRDASGAITGWDNSQPRKVTYRVGTNEVVSSDPLTGPDRDRWEKEKNAAAGLGAFTDAELRGPAPGRPESATDTGKPLQGHPGWTIKSVATKDGNGNSVTKTVYVSPDGKEQDTPPVASPVTGSDTVPLEGSPGWSVRKTQTKDANGNTVTTVVYIGPDGQEHASLPTGTPIPRPNVVAGNAVAALRAYGEQLDAEVAAGRITQAQATQRWNEALQLAPIAINEATLAQRRAEAELQAETTLSGNRYNNVTSGFNAALSAVQHMNDRLPEGSTLGGQAFVAMLGLQLMSAQNAGVYNTGIDRRGPQPAAGAAAQPATPATPPNAIGLGAIGPVPAPGGAAASPFATATRPWTDPNASPSVVNPPAPQPAAAAAPAPPPASVLDPYRQPPPTPGEPGGPPLQPGPVLGDPPAPAPGAPPVRDDWRQTPPPVNPLPGQPGNDPTKPVGMVSSPALLQAQAATTVPWQMSPEQYAAYRQAGVPDEVIWSVPRYG